MMVPIARTIEPYEAILAASAGDAAGADRQLRHGGGHVDRAGPEQDDRDREEARHHERGGLVLGREQSAKRLGHRGTALLGVAEFVLPLLRLVHAVPDERNHQCGYTAENEHPPPSVSGADEVIRDRREEEPEVVARMHQPGAPLPRALIELLGDVGGADRLFAADPDAAEKPQNGELVNVRHESAEERKQRIAEDRQHQRADAPDAIADGAPDHRRAPSRAGTGQTECCRNSRCSPG